MMSIEKRIRLLEQNAADLPWPDTTINIFVGDGRLNPPDPQPDRLQMVVRAGCPGGGCTFHREPGETEQEFIERTKQ